MITDDAKKTEIQGCWDTVEKLRAFENWVPILNGGPVGVSSFMPEPFWNFPFFLAYAVLDDTLGALQDQGLFASGTWKLGPKMKASEPVLPWQDFTLVDVGRQARNNLAHKAEFLAKKECFAYVAAVKTELVAWNVLQPN